MTSKSLCTIVCDASWCPDTRVGAWAAWVVCEGTRVKQYAAFKDLCESATIAECQAAINGAAIAAARFQPARYHFVVDCLAVPTLLNVDPFQPLLQDIVKGAVVTFAHVKGHTSDTAARSWVNRWCDKHARETMRKARRKING